MRKNVSADPDDDLSTGNPPDYYGDEAYLRGEPPPEAAGDDKPDEDEVLPPAQIGVLYLVQVLDTWDAPLYVFAGIYTSREKALKSMDDAETYLLSKIVPDSNEESEEETFEAGRLS